MSKPLSPKLKALFEATNKTNKLKLIGMQADLEIVGSSSTGSMATIPTGILSLDRAIGLPGIPRGRLTHIYGENSSGKTTTALHIIAAAQREGLTAMLYDFEMTYDPAYGAAIGIDNESLIYGRPHPDTGGEGVLEIILEVLRTGEVDLLVIDSIATIIPAKKLDSDVGRQLPAIQARLITEYVQRLNPVITWTNTALVCINQLTSTMKADFYGNPILIPRGGMALQYASSLNLRVTSSKRANEKDEPETKDTKITVDKNKVGKPYLDAELLLKFGVGFDPVTDVISVATSEGLITKNGAWYDIEIDGKNQRVQGEEKLATLLETNLDVFYPLYEKTKNALAVSIIKRRQEWIDEQQARLADFKRFNDSATAVRAALVD